MLASDFQIQDDIGLSLQQDVTSRMAITTLVHETKVAAFLCTPAYTVLASSTLQSAVCPYVPHSKETALKIGNKAQNIMFQVTFSDKRRKSRLQKGNVHDCGITRGYLEPTTNAHALP